MLVSGSYGGIINICDIHSGKLKATLKSGKNDHDSIKSLVKFNDGIISAYLYDGIIKIWRFQDFETALDNYVKLKKRSKNGINNCMLF
jgi:hypothetical protein